MPGGDAQSLQVKSMAKAFNAVVKDDFFLISPKNKKNEDTVSDYKWEKVSVPDYLPRFLRYAILILKASTIVRRIKPDFIYTRDIGIAFIYKLIGFETVYEIHKSFETKIGGFIFKIISRKIKLVAISGALKDFVVEKYNLKNVNILVAHDGVFLEDFTRIEKSKEELKKEYLNLAKDKFVVLYSGSLQKGKGMELILTAAKMLGDVIFIIVGGNYSDKIIKDELENLLFLGRKPQEKLPFYLKSADLLVLPNTKELPYYRYTSPLKMFEYMASGVPMLASDLVSIKEVLNSENAFLFNPENVMDFIEKIKYIEANYQEADKKAKLAFENVKNFTWQKRAENIIKFLNHGR